MKPMKKMMRVYITTDVHGTLKTSSYADFSDKQQGLGRYLTAIKKARKDGEILVLDNGDILQGSPLLTYFQKEPRKPHLMAQALNLIGVDFFNLGNHDFNYGQTILTQFLQDLKAPCLTSNITLNSIPFGQSRLITMNGLKIALIGACTVCSSSFGKTFAHCRNDLSGSDRARQSRSASAETASGSGHRDVSRRLGARSEQRFADRAFDR